MNRPILIGLNTAKYMNTGKALVLSQAQKYTDDS